MFWLPQVQRDMNGSPMTSNRLPHKEPQVQREMTAHR
jgi:hypothetical protein